MRKEKWEMRNGVVGEWERGIAWSGVTTATSSQVLRVFGSGVREAAKGLPTWARTGAQMTLSAG